jgi:hypothetical protein
MHSGQLLECLDYRRAWIDNLELCMAHELRMIELAGFSVTGDPILLQCVKPDELGG